MNQISDDLKVVHFELSNRKINIIFPTTPFVNKEGVSFFCKKRKEEKRYYLKCDMKVIKDSTLVSIEIEQFKKYFQSEVRLDLYMENLNEVGENPVRVYFAKFSNNIERYQKPVYLKNDFYLSSYITKNNHVSIVINTEEKIKSEMFEGHVKLHKLKVKKVNLNVSFDIDTKVKVEIKAIILKHRKGPEQIRIKLGPNQIKENRVEISLDMKNVELLQFYWDFYVEVISEKLGNVHLRVKNFSILNKFKLQYFPSIFTIKNKNDYIILPYITQSEDFSINYRLKGRYEDKKFKINEIIAFILYILFGFFFIGSKIWLIHEKFSETAQDNSFSFFKYCYKNHPNKKVYFVIKKESEDCVHTIPYKKRVAHFMSVKHLFLILVSKRIISSEAKGHGFAWRVSQGMIKPRLNQKKYIFLQHGVLGLKKVDGTFNANGNNHADLFVTSSEIEKNIVHDYLGYPLENIIVTGLARWDELERQHTHEKTEILCMPTWRNWLEEVTDEEFIRSDYFQKYLELITSTELRNFLSEQDLYLNFYLHPKFIQYAKLFNSVDNRINIIEFGEQTVNSLIKRSSMLITDYSSVAWEYCYLDKPVLFFQFDKGKYESLQGSYLDLDKDLFGRNSFDVNTLICHLKELVAAGMKLDNSIIKQKSKFFKYIDQNNCSRIYQEIIKNEESTSHKEELMYALKRSPIVRTVWRKVKGIRT
ncbi:CDP-glycerol glycerophosphotransferase family protein [Neobacillus vireti]|uniref:Uncharacterized protein n=1 Tax=Neobacillus vireti LMG 21834 TaxID=1131730 RepID=A0AB94IQ15_9BACI|nr:CDP-glycerol glycerophosphotransferase family protein [Neobacillus vireti]ETI69165.1 hypothetical protein BAVI_08701 [Neobacillus vireti LMG 21834]KLT15543.1 hypothetical protein AA980_23145 [Neobacillus vireti]